jgi:hypothetical protein
MAADSVTEKSTFAAPASATSGLQNYDLGGAPRRRKRRKTAGDPAKEQSMDQQLKLFIPITKIDAAKRLVYGIATAELPDAAGEICDYASTKPLYQKWSDDFSKATEGKSLGNLRAMHAPIAAGKLTEIAFDDDAKKIEICAKVVDDAEWAKVEEGVYTGFSQGGKYIKRWTDGEHTRYTAEPIEVSLVDNPCLPEATFSVIKADGSTELRKFKSPAAGEAAKVETPNDNAVGRQVWVNDRLPGQTFAKKADLLQALLEQEAEAAAKKTAAPVFDALADIQTKLGLAKGGDGAGVVTLQPSGIADPLDKRDYTDEERKEYAKNGMAMKDGSYPIPDTDALKDAIEAYSQAKNKAATQRHIIKRAKALGATDMLPEDWSGSAKKKDESKKLAGDGELAKNLYFISNLVQLLAGIECSEDDYELITRWGADDPERKQLCDRFGEVLTDFADLVADILDCAIAHISAEEKGEADGTIERARLFADLAKVGARHSKIDKAKIAQMHDLCVELDEDCCDGGAEDDDDAEKMVKALQSERDADRKAFGKTIEEMMVLLKQIAEQPTPMGTSSVTLRVVDKTVDSTDFGKVADDLDKASTGDDGLHRLADAAQRHARRLTAR